MDKKYERIISHIERLIRENRLRQGDRLSDGVNSSALEKRLKERNIFVSPGRNFFIDGKEGENGFRLCISKLTKDQIKIGTGIILEEINSRI